MIKINNKDKNSSLKYSNIYIYKINYFLNFEIKLLKLILKISKIKLLQKN